MLSLDENTTPRATTDSVRSLLRSTAKRNAGRQLVQMRETAEKLRKQKRNDDYMWFMPRRWSTGDVYAPHDMSPAEMRKWSVPRPRKQDVIDVLNLNPLDMYRVRPLESCFQSHTLL
jgi:small subunit ribosomal protein S18